ncbi:MAG: DHH family phosphoesterase [Verrucomicrobia bacterium]|nr:DHH family phosphoesterase [Verrucomicrobiota bacterium]
MLSLPKPEVILTHESDLDGFVSGLLLQRLAHKLHGDDVPLEAHHYQSWRQRTLRERAAWVADFTFEPRMDRAGWLVVDHHPTDAPARNATLIHDTTKSASLLCHELCREHGLVPQSGIDRIVHLTNVGDLFLEDDPDFALANDYSNLVKSYQFWNLHALIGGELERLLDHPLLEVMAVKRRVEDPLGLAWSRANVQRLGPDVGYVDTVVGNINLIVHQLLEQRATPFPVLLTLFMKANRTVIVSLRSRNGEALKVAARLQGGGHPNACGAVLPRHVQSIPDALDYLRAALDPAFKRDAGLNSLESAFAGLQLPK